MNCMCVCIPGSGKERAVVVRREMNLGDAETRDGHAKSGAAAGIPGRTSTTIVCTVRRNNDECARSGKEAAVARDGPPSKLCGEQRRYGQQHV